jgi:hypothetical protein
LRAGLSFCPSLVPALWRTAPAVWGPGGGTVMCEGTVPPPLFFPGLRGIGGRTVPHRTSTSGRRQERAAAAYARSSTGAMCRMACRRFPEAPPRPRRRAGRDQSPQRSRALQDHIIPIRKGHRTLTVLFRRTADTRVEGSKGRIVLAAGRRCGPCLFDEASEACLGKQSHSVRVVMAPHGGDTGSNPVGGIESLITGR